jgi:hypothetical protein
MSALEFNSQFTGAVFSPCHKYRLVLWRKWRPEKPSVMFIGINPSTADAQTDDATIRRVISFAQSWGYGGLYMLNLFTCISTDPAEIKKINNPSWQADWAFRTYRGMVEKVIFAWGNNKAASERAKEVIKIFPEAYVLGLNKDGSPKHPSLFAEVNKNDSIY